MIDPRINIIERRLRNVKRVYAVVSSKGGVGKTFFSVAISLRAAARNLNVGLIDLDFTSPSCHLFLGVDVSGAGLPKEDKGVLPHSVYGVKFMSLAYYTGDEPLALRGIDIDNAIKELFSITLWGDLDVLFIDTPPGMSDELLDLIALIKRLRVVVITTPDLASIRSVERMIGILKKERARVAGIIENMSKGTSEVKSLASKYGLRYLGNIPYLAELSLNLKNFTGLVKTRLSKEIDRVLRKLLEPKGAIVDLA